MVPLRKVLLGSVSNIFRLTLTILVGCVLPPILVRHLSYSEYSAWVLILQLSSYVTLFDFGLQTVLTKLVAEYSSTGDHQKHPHLLSSAFCILTVAAFFGLCAVLAMVWRVPQLFQQMPRSLLPQVRLSLFIVGFSSAIALPFGPFLSVFSGLQEYGFPTALIVLSRILSASVLICVTMYKGSLVQLSLTIALINVITAIAQFYGWRRYAKGRFPFAIARFDGRSVSHLLRSGGAVVIWSVGGLFVSGLDTVIVGHFDYASTGFYAVGATGTNLMLLIVSAIFSPLVPAVSALQTTRTSVQIGEMTITISRYCTLILCILALPIIIGAFPLLSFWLGRSYAMRSAAFLQILVVGNFIRQLAYPYSLVVVATGKQHLAAFAAVAEAVVNVLLSVWLASKIGAVGVAAGTVAGAIVSFSVHLVVSMRLTRGTISLSRWQLLKKGFARPLLCALPVFFLIPYWRPDRMLPANSVALTVWFAASLFIGVVFSLTAADRTIIRQRFVDVPGTVRK